MKIFWEDAFNFWLPSKILEKNSDALRLKVFIRVCYFILFVGISTLLLNLIAKLDPEIVRYHIVASSSCIALGIIMFIIIKTTGNLELTYHTAAITGLFILSLPVFNSGGIYSSTVWWIMIFPVSGFFIISKRAGIFWTIVALIYILIVFFQTLFDGFAKETLDTEYRRLVDMFMITLFISFVMFVYEKNQNLLLTQMKKTQKELHKQNTSLKELNRENETLMAIVAHDLRSPQHQLQSILKLIEKEFQKNNLPQEYIQLANKILSDSLQLVNDITITKEISMGELQIKKESLDLAEFLRKQCLSFEATANEKKIALIQKIPDQEILIDTDKEILSRIVQNLISNAIKFSPFNKSVYVSLTNVNSKHILSVKDEGPGINQEEQKLLFKRFQKLSARPTNQEHSSGLGLYIVKILCGKIGASIEVTSIEGHGAEFTVTFPV